MRLRRFSMVLGVFLIAIAPTPGVLGQASAVPQDLKPLLAKPVSEMRLVVTRYNADRQTLNANYAGPGGFNMPGGRGGGRGAAAGATTGAAPRTPVPISTARLARLKRFDLDWQAAVSAHSRPQSSPRPRLRISTTLQVVDHDAI